jgi:LysR family carnitine catabolism transcriptional activator
MSINIGLRQLRAFHAVAELSSFSAAATRLHLSQPALSATIQKLEDALKVRLFDRTTRQVLLTPEGEELLRLSARLLDEFETVTGDFQDYIARSRGRIVVAALPSMAATILPPALATLKNRHPGIEVVIRDTLHNEIQMLVESGAADFGLTVTPSAARTLEFQPLLIDRFVMVCRRDHELAKQSAVTWEQLVRHPHITMSKTSSVQQHIDAACAQAGIELRNQYDAAHLATVGALVRAGLGVAALPSLAIPLLQFAALSEVPIRSPQVKRTMGIVRRVGRSPSVAAQALLDILVSSLNRRR